MTVVTNSYSLNIDPVVTCICSQFKLTNYINPEGKLLAFSGNVLTYYARLKEYIQVRLFYNIEEVKMCRFNHVLQ